MIKIILTESQFRNMIEKEIDELNIGTHSKDRIDLRVSKEYRLVSNIFNTKNTNFFQFPEIGKISLSDGLYNEIKTKFAKSVITKLNSYLELKNDCFRIIVYKLPFAEIMTDYLFRIQEGDWINKSVNTDYGVSVTLTNKKALNLFKNYNKKNIDKKINSGSDLIFLVKTEMDEKKEHSFGDMFALNVYRTGKIKNMQWDRSYDIKKKEENCVYETITINIDEFIKNEKYYEDNKISLDYLNRLKSEKFFNLSIADLKNYIVDIKKEKENLKIRNINFIKHKHIEDFENNFEPIFNEVKKFYKNIFYKSIKQNKTKDELEEILYDNLDKLTELKKPFNTEIIKRSALESQHNFTFFDKDLIKINNSLDDVNKLEKCITLSDCQIEDFKEFSKYFRKEYANI